MTIGNRIKSTRLKKGFSQRELARKSGLSSAYMCQLEKGNRDIGVSKLIKISQALEVSVNYLLDIKPLQPSPYSMP